MDQENTDSSRNALMTTLAVLLVVVLITGGAMALKRRDNSNKLAKAGQTVATNTTQASDEPVAATPAATEQTAPATTPAAAPSSFKDGTYTATGSYSTPGGQSQIGITLTLKNGVVTDTNAESIPNSPDSAEFQAEFISGYKSLVVGKNIANIKLSKVSGSSLTPRGFNDALAQIKSQAAA